MVLSEKSVVAWRATGAEFDPISERLMRIRLKMHSGHVSVFAVYAPTNEKGKESETERFYAELQHTWFHLAEESRRGHVLRLCTNKPSFQIQHPRHQSFQVNIPALIWHMAIQRGSCELVEATHHSSAQEGGI